MNTHLATVSTKGQLVLPSQIREALAIKPGTRMVVSREGNRIVLQPVNAQYLRETRGMTAGGESMTEQLIAERREENRQSEW